MENQYLIRCCPFPRRPPRFSYHPLTQLCTLTGLPLLSLVTTLIYQITGDLPVSGPVTPPRFGMEWFCLLPFDVGGIDAVLA